MRSVTRALRLLNTTDVTLLSQQLREVPRLRMRAGCRVDGTRAAFLVLGDLTHIGQAGVDLVEEEGRWVRHRMPLGWNATWLYQYDEERFWCYLINHYI